MTTATPEVDPLETYESVPAVSFHEPNGGYPMGKWAKLEVRDWPQLIQQRDDDGNPEFWEPREGEQPQPKLVLVVPVYDGVDEDGNKVEKNLWAKKMGKAKTQSIYQQLAAAQKKVRNETGDKTYRLGPGDTLAIQFVSEDRSVKPIKGNYPKNYKAVIQVGQRPAPNADPFSDADAPADSSPFADEPAAPASSSPTQPGGDPFGAAAPGEDDEPPF